MKPIGAFVERGPWQPFETASVVQRIAVSPLVRHLVTLQIRETDTDLFPLNKQSLALLAQHAPNLTSLWCAVELAPKNNPLVLPAKLQSLHLQLGSAYPNTEIEYTDAEINGMLMTVAALPSLSHLHLRLSALDDTCVELWLLAACSSLSDLTIEAIDGNPPDLSDAQVEQIRSSLGQLQRLSLGQWVTSDELARYLKPPVTARWQDIGSVRIDARSGKLLLRLPSVTKLDLCYERVTAHVDFLPQLPFLTVLNLQCDRRVGSGWGWMSPTDALLTSLPLCLSLTDLSLTCGFKSAYWCALLAKLTKVKKLAFILGSSSRCNASRRDPSRSRSRS